MLPACAPAVRPVERQTPLTWPPESAAARIAFVRTFSRPDDLGIGRGFFQRLADVHCSADPIPSRASDGRGRGRRRRVCGRSGREGRASLRPGEGRLRSAACTGDRPLPSPVGLARGADGEVYVTDSALASVFVIRPGAKIAEPVPLRASLGQPTGIAFDPATGRLFVVDTTAHRVNVFTATAPSSRASGGAAPGTASSTIRLFCGARADGRLYVTDSLNFRVQIFDTRGRFLAKFGRLGDGTGDLMRQKGVATDSYGHIYVVDALFNAMQVFDDSGRFLLSVGALGRDRGEFWLPTGIFIGENDTIYVADSYNQRVQVFRYIGGPT